MAPPRTRRLQRTVQRHRRRLRRDVCGGDKVASVTRAVSGGYLREKLSDRWIAPNLNERKRQ